jgi:hypothetical protein
MNKDLHGVDYPFFPRICYRCLGSRSYQIRSFFFLLGKLLRLLDNHAAVYLVVVRASSLLRTPTRNGQKRGKCNTDSHGEGQLS